MKVVASVQAKRSSSRGLVHYIAHSKIDASKEAKGREIFNEYANDLAVEKANDFLKKGVSAKRPPNEELHHLVISIKVEDFERLGSDEKERHQSLKEITRQAMKQFEKEIGADGLNWAAGIHQNTDNPHIHIAIQKEYFDKNLEKKTLSKIPTALIPHYEKKEKIEAKFSATELAEVESLAFDLKLDDVYQENWEHQIRLIETAEGKGQIENSSPNESKENLIAGRAIAREVLSEIESTRAKEEYAQFKKHKDFQQFEIIDKKTGEAKFVSLAEVRFDSSGSIFDQTLEYFLENREKRRTRHTLEKQVKEKGAELKENVKSANNLLQVAREIASDFKTKSFFGGTRYHHPPIFTPKELITIELRIIQTTSKSEAKNLQKTLDLADTSQAKNLLEILQTFETKKENSKSIGSFSPDEQKIPIQVEKNEAKSQEKVAKIQENKTEILNQDRGR